MNGRAPCRGGCGYGGAGTQAAFCHSSAGKVAVKQPFPGARTLAMSVLQADLVAGVPEA